jgi:hypothetical protein
MIKFVLARDIGKQTKRVLTVQFLSYLDEGAMDAHRRLFWDELQIHFCPIT